MIVSLASNIHDDEDSNNLDDDDESSSDDQARKDLSTKVMNYEQIMKCLGKQTLKVKQ